MNSTLFWKTVLPVLLLTAFSCRGEFSSEEIALVVERGVKELEEGDAGPAIRSFESALREDPLNPIILGNLGRAHARRGDYRRGIVYHRLAIGLDRRMREPYFNIACYYSLSGNNGMALRWLRKGMEMGFDYKEEMKRDESLKLLREDFRYLRYLKTGRLSDSLVDASFHASPLKIFEGDDLEVSLVVILAEELLKGAGDVMVEPIGRGKMEGAELSLLKIEKSLDEGLLFYRVLFNFRGFDEGMKRIPDIKVSVMDERGGVEEDFTTLCEGISIEVVRDPSFRPEGVEGGMDVREVLSLTLGKMQGGD